MKLVVRKHKFRPFLKWAGGKTSLIHQINSLLPSGRRLIEPFVGSGAVFLNTSFSKYLLADSNQDLIDVFQFVKDEGRHFIADCRVFFDGGNDPEVFYNRRARFNSTKNRREKALLFVYLNRHCFNGLCRYNQQQKFNTPFGRYRTVYFPERELLMFSTKSKGVRFLCSDFEKVMDKARPGDVVYCDPPYAPLSRTSNFTSYHSSIFGPNEQTRLAQTAERLAEKGVPVLISNHNTPFVQKQYSRAHRVTLEVQRNISCKGSQRGKAKELLAFFAPS